MMEFPLVSLALIGLLSATAQTPRLGSWTPGPPKEMDALASLVGEWDVVAKPAAGGETTGSRPFTVTSELGGTTLVMRGVYPMTPEVNLLVLLSYDRFQARYRLVVADDFSGLLDVYEGGRTQNRLELDNVRSGTISTHPEGGPAQSLRLRFTLAADRFSIETDSSVDAGTSWKPAATLSFTRRRHQNP